MNITESLSAIAEVYPRVEKTLGNMMVKEDTFEVSSGGIKAMARDPEPAFYLMSAAAIAAWKTEVMQLLSEKRATGFMVLDGPHLDKWNITVADGKYTHRTAEDRYSVTARIGVVREVLYVSVADDPGAEFRVIEEPTVELPASMVKSVKTAKATTKKKVVA